MPKSKSRNKRHSSQFSRQEQRYSRNVKENTSWIFSALAVVLHKRYGFGKKRITDVLTDVQGLFHEHQGDVVQIVRLASEETGLVLISEQTARELGVDLENETRV